MPQEQSAIRQRERLKTDEPKRYSVVIHNDDFTTMDFVVMVLKLVFYKSDLEAEKLMLKVHHEGKAVAGVYTLDIAQSKVAKATKMAREENFPLRFTVQPE